MDPLKSETECWSLAEWIGFQSGAKGASINIESALSILQQKGVFVTRLTPDNFCDIYEAAFLNDPDLKRGDPWLLDYCQCGASNSSFTDPLVAEQACFAQKPGECIEKQGCARMDIVIDTRASQLTRLDYCFNLTHYMDLVFPDSSTAADFLMLIGTSEKLMNNFNWCPLMSAGGFALMDKKGKVVQCETQGTPNVFFIF